MRVYRYNNGKFPENLLLENQESIPWYPANKDRLFIHRLPGSYEWHLLC